MILADWNCVDKAVGTQIYNIQLRFFVFYFFFVVVVTTVASDTINMECIIRNRTKFARPLEYTRTYFACGLTSKIFCMIISTYDYFHANEFRCSWMIISKMLWITICDSIEPDKSSRCILLFHQIILFHSNIHRMVNSSSTVLNIESNPLVKNIYFISKTTTRLQNETKTTLVDALCMQSCIFASWYGKICFNHSL